MAAGNLSDSELTAVVAKGCGARMAALEYNCMPVLLLLRCGPTCFFRWEQQQ